MSVSRSLMGEWLVPFKGRNDSGACDLNFLWRSGSLYVMDNHRAASWCWLQQSGPEGNANVVHIDAHYDTVGAGGRSSENQPPTASLGLREYLNASFLDAGETISVYRWDNYISLLRHHHPRFGSDWTFATHRIGTRPDFEYTDVCPDALVDTLEALLTSRQRFILNLDLDYFRSRKGDRLAQKIRSQVFERIAEFMRQDQLVAFTVCLSPECCGSWASSEELLRELMKTLGVDFALPPAA
jgi:hypothetical protein